MVTTSSWAVDPSPGGQPAGDVGEGPPVERIRCRHVPVLGSHPWVAAWIPPAWRPLQPRGCRREAARRPRGEALGPAAEILPPGQAPRQRGVEATTEALGRGVAAETLGPSRILPVPRQMRSGSQATTRAKDGLAERLPNPSNSLQVL